jgi:hypothetical protein
MNAQKQQQQDAIPFGAHVVLQKLDEEIALLKEAMAKIDPCSKDPGDLWALPIYQKIIKRREKLVECLGG